MAWYDLLESIAITYHVFLTQVILPQANHPVTQYVRKRGLTDHDIAHWQIGYAPKDWVWITPQLIDIGAVAIAEELGVVSRTDDGRYRDFFHDRLLLPLFSDTGKVLGFTGRSIGEPPKTKSGDKLPKYLNTKQTPLFTKGDLLYGLHRAKRSITASKQLVLTEGNLDVVALHRAGVTNAVCKSGTAFTARQLAMIREIAESVTLIYDQDPAGDKARQKDLELLLDAGIRVKLVELPALVDGDGNRHKMDADSWIRHLERAEPPLDDLAATVADEIKKSAQDGLVSEAQRLLDTTDTDAVLHGLTRVVGWIAALKTDVEVESYLRFVCKACAFNPPRLRKLVDAARRSNAKDDKTPAKNDPASPDHDGSLPDWVDPKEYYHWSMAERVVPGDARSTGYYFPGPSGQPADKPLTNFILEPLFHLMERGNVRRLAVAKNSRMERVIELDGQSLQGPDRFEGVLSDAGNFYCHEGFVKHHLIRIKSKLMEKTQKPAYPIRTMGFQPEGFFAFSNAVYSGELEHYNQYGVVEVGDKHFFSPALSPVTSHYRLEGDPFKQDRYLSYAAPVHPFSEWAAQLHQVYGERAVMGSLYVVAALMRDLIMRYTKMPMLYCYGPKDSGKSTFAESLMYVFFGGRDAMGDMVKPLNFGSNPTTFAFWQTVGRFRNCVFVLNEFDENSIDPQFVNALKSVYDNEGRLRGNRSDFQQTEEQKVNCLPVLVGQYLSSADDASVVSRCLTLEFQDRKDNPFTAKQVADFRKLQAWQRENLSGILTELLPMRGHVEKNLETVLTAVRQELMDFLAKQTLTPPNRTLDNVAVMLALYDLLADRVTWPLTREAVWEYAGRLMREMSRVLTTTDALSGFWGMMEYLIDRGEIVEGRDYKIEVSVQEKILSGGGTDIRKFDKPRNLLYLRLGHVHKPYAEHTRRETKNNPMSEGNLATYIKQQRYYVGNTKHSYFAGLRGNTSAMVIDYEDFTTRTGINLERAPLAEAPAPLPQRVLIGQQVGELKTLPIGTGPDEKRIQFTLTVTDTILLDHTENAPTRTVQYGVKVLARPDLLPDLTALVAGSWWRVTGGLDEKTWKDADGNPQYKRTLDLTAIEPYQEPDSPAPPPTNLDFFAPQTTITPF